MTWTLFWSVLGVAAALSLLLAPVLYVLMRWEVRRVFRPLSAELDQMIREELGRTSRLISEGRDKMIVQRDITQKRMDRLLGRVPSIGSDGPGQGDR